MELSVQLLIWNVRMVPRSWTHLLNQNLVRKMVGYHSPQLLVQRKLLSFRKNLKTDLTDNFWIEDTYLFVWKFTSDIYPHLHLVLYWLFLRSHNHKVFWQVNLIPISIVHWYSDSYMYFKTVRSWSFVWVHFFLPPFPLILHRPGHSGSSFLSKTLSFLFERQWQSNWSPDCCA